MKFRCERDVLVEASAPQHGQRRSGWRASGLASGVRIELVGNHLELTGSDLDLTIQVTRK